MSSRNHCLFSITRSPVVLGHRQQVLFHGHRGGLPMLAARASSQQLQVAETWTTLDGENVPDVRVE